MACDRPVELAAFAAVPEPVELRYLLCKGYISPSAVTYLPCKGYLTSNTPSITLAISTLIVAVPTFRYPSQSRYIRAFASLCGGVLSLGVVAGAFVCAGMEGAFAC